MGGGRAGSALHCPPLYVLLQPQIIALRFETLRLLLLQLACLPVGGAAAAVGRGGPGACGMFAALAFVELLLVPALPVHLLARLGLPSRRLLFSAFQEALPGRLDGLVPVPLIEFQ